MLIPPQYESLSPVEIAKLMGVTTSAVVQAQRRANGYCPYCDTPALTGLTLCALHRTQKVASSRRRAGSSPWKPGGQGRPPVRVK